MSYVPISVVSAGYRRHRSIDRVREMNRSCAVLLGILAIGAVSWRIALAKPDATIRQAHTYVHVLPDGSRVELTAVRFAEFGKIWNPDGTRSKVARASFRDAATGIDRGRLALIKVIVSHARDERIFSPMVKTIGDYALIEPEIDRSDLWTCLREFDPPNGASRISIPVRVALSDYRVSGTARYRKLGRVSGGIFSDPIVPYKTSDRAIDFVHGGLARAHRVPAKDAFYVRYDLPTSAVTQDYRFEAYDRNGNRFQEAGWDPEKHEAHFLGDAKKVAKIQLLVRPIEQFSFDNVVVRQ